MDACECLDECDSINYKTEVVAHSLKTSINSTGNPDTESYFESEIEFKFKDVDIVPLRRYRQMTFTDFLAQSGGMMGLFAGISVLSIIEVFYFMTLRWMVNLWRWILKK
jgi:acid-sensing ion channel, other